MQPCGDQAYVHGPGRAWRQRHQPVIDCGSTEIPRANVDYAAAKGAVDSTPIGMAKELAANGILVNAARSGVIDTEIHARRASLDGSPESFPMARGGMAEEVAQAILWLTSVQASYTTGALLDVSGDH